MPSVCSLGAVFPVVGGVVVGLSPCGKGGDDICQVALLSSIIAELWRYGQLCVGGSAGGADVSADHTATTLQ